jgi:hypothetical protein
MSVKIRYGVDDHGMLSPCRAKHGNEGKYGCHHVDHVELTRDEYQERMEQAYKNSVLGESSALGHRNDGHSEARKISHIAKPITEIPHIDSGQYDRTTGRFLNSPIALMEYDHESMKNGYASIFTVVGHDGVDKIALDDKIRGLSALSPDEVEARGAKIASELGLDANHVKSDELVRRWFHDNNDGSNDHHDEIVGPLRNDLMREIVPFLPRSVTSSHDSIPLSASYAKADTIQRRYGQKDTKEGKVAGFYSTAGTWSENVVHEVGFNKTMTFGAKDVLESIPIGHVFYNGSGHGMGDPVNDTPDALSNAAGGMEAGVGWMKVSDSTCKKVWIGKRPRGHDGTRYVKISDSVTLSGWKKDRSTHHVKVYEVQSQDDKAGHIIVIRRHGSRDSVNSKDFMLNQLAHEYTHYLTHQHPGLMDPVGKMYDSLKEKNGFPRANEYAESPIYMETNPTEFIAEATARMIQPKGLASLYGSDHDEQLKRLRNWTIGFWASLA